MLSLEPYFLNKDVLLDPSEYHSLGPSGRGLYSIMSKSIKDFCWELLEDSSHSTMMELKFHLLWNVYVVLEIFKPLYNNYIKIRLQDWNSFLYRVCLTRDGVVTTWSSMSPARTPVTLVLLGLGTRLEIFSVCTLCILRDWRVTWSTSHTYPLCHRVWV